MTLEELAQKEVNVILEEVDDIPLRALMENACKKAFARGALFGIGRGHEEANVRIAELEGEVWDLKREIRMLS